MPMFHRNKVSQSGLTRFVLLVGLFVGILVVSAVALFIHNRPHKLTPAQIQAQLQIQAQKPNTTTFKTYNNFESLTSTLTVFQQEALKTALFKFNNSAGTFSIISQSVKSLPHNPNSTYDVVTFSVIIDQKTYRAQLRYFNLNSVRMFLLDTKGRLVFDSGTVKGN